MHRTSVATQIRTWFVRDSSKKASFDLRRYYDLGFAIVLTIGPMALGFSVIWKWITWTLCWVLCVGVFFPDWIPVLRTFPSKTKRVAFVAVIVVFGCGFYPTARNQFQIEQAEEIEGTLVADGPLPIPDAQKNIDQYHFGTEIGHSGTWFETSRSNPYPLSLFGNELEYSQSSDGKVEISTVVRDKTGNLIAEIHENHWKVPHDNSWDKNYDKNCLEVKDKRGIVVLQVCVFTNGVQLQEVTYNKEGTDGYSFVESPPTMKPGALYNFCPPTRADTVCDNPIEPMFKYSSQEYWGQISNK